MTLETTTADHELLQAYATRRNATAFAELVRRYAGLVYGVGLRITGNGADAQDIAQECFLQLAAQAERITQPVPAWLHTLARSRALDLLRRQGARHKYERQAGVEAVTGLSAQEWEILVAQVDEAIAGLDEELRLPLLGMYLQGRTQQQLAEDLSVSQGTVSRRIERAIDELRTRLRQQGVEVSALALVPLLTQIGSPMVPTPVLAALNKIGLSGVGASGTAGTLGAVVAKVAMVALILAMVAGIIYSISTSQHSQPRGLMTTPDPTTNPTTNTAANPTTTPATLPATTAPTTTMASTQSASRLVQLDLGAGVGMMFVPIPAGEFRMGKAPGKVVAIPKAFYLGQHLVTRQQFARFVAETGYKTTAEKEGKSPGVKYNRWQDLPGANWNKPGFDQAEDHPVVCVSPDDAQAFCAWLSQKTGRKVRLPQDAEWEYACRAGTQTMYFWGDDPMGGAGFMNAEDGAWRIEKNLGSTDRDMEWADGFRFTSPVGAFKPNPWGLHDMLGNLWEPTTNPPSWRGGTWDYPPSFNRCHLRQNATTTTGQSWDSGLRVALDDNVQREQGKMWLEGLQPGARDTNPYAQGMAIILQYLGHKDATYTRMMGYSGVAFCLQMDMSGPIHNDKYDVAWWPNDCYVFDMSVPRLAQAFGRELRKVAAPRPAGEFMATYHKYYEPEIIQAISRGVPVLAQQTAGCVITGYDANLQQPIVMWPTPGQPVFGPSHKGLPWGLFVPGAAFKAQTQEEAEMASLRWAVALWDETAAATCKDWDTSKILTGSKAYARWLELLEEQRKGEGLGRDSWDNNLVSHMRYNRTAAVAYLRDLATRRPPAVAAHISAAADRYQKVCDDVRRAPLWGQFKSNPEVRPAKLQEYTDMVRRCGQWEAEAIAELRQVTPPVQ